MWCYNNNKKVFFIEVWEIAFIVKSAELFEIYHYYSVNPTFITSRKNS